MNIVCCFYFVAKGKRQIIFWGEKVNSIFYFVGKGKGKSFSRFHASPLHSEGGSRAWCLKTIDARQMNQSKLSGEQCYMQHEKQSTFIRMLDLKTYLHLIEKAILKTMCVEILVVPWFYSSYCKSLILSFN